MTPQELKKIRAKLGMNQKNFGLHLGFSDKGAQIAISELENGKRNIHKSTQLLARYISKDRNVK